MLFIWACHFEFLMTVTASGHTHTPLTKGAGRKMHVKVRCWKNMTDVYEEPNVKGRCLWLSWQTGWKHILTSRFLVYYKIVKTHLTFKINVYGLVTIICIALRRVSSGTIAKALAPSCGRCWRWLLSQPATQPLSPLVPYFNWPGFVPFALL